MAEYEGATPNFYVAYHLAKDETIIQVNQVPCYLVQDDNISKEHIGQVISM